MAHAGEDHGKACFIGGDDLLVAQRPAGLDHRGRPCLGGLQQSSAKGKKASEATTEPLVGGSSRPAARAASAALRAAMRTESTRGHLSRADAVTVAPCWRRRWRSISHAWQC